MVSRWLWPGNGTFLEVASMVVTWWIMTFCAVYIGHYSFVREFNCNALPIIKDPTNTYKITKPKILQDDNEHERA